RGAPLATGCPKTFRPPTTATFSSTGFPSQASRTSGRTWTMVSERGPVVQRQAYEPAIVQCVRWMVVIDESCSLAMAAPQPIENQHPSYEGFEKKPDKACPTPSMALVSTGIEFAQLGQYAACPIVHGAYAASVSEQSVLVKEDIMPKYLPRLWALAF